MRIGPFGIWEILIILVVILVVFGPRRLPELAKGIGQSVREFRRGIRDMRDEFDDEAAPDGRAAAATNRRPRRDAGATSEAKIAPDVAEPAHPQPPV